ncbi:MAG: hypothetical protein RLY14_2597, partial [Planctomycetota bacterium]
PIVPIKSYQGIGRVEDMGVEQADGLGSIRFCKSRWGGHLGFVERWIGSNRTVLGGGRLDEAHGQGALAGRWMDRWVVEKIMVSSLEHPDRTNV